MKRPLRELMGDRGVNARKLAKMSGLSEAAISQILSGKEMPKLATARRIASTLGIGVDEIMFPAEAASQASNRDAPSQEAQAA